MSENDEVVSMERPLVEVMEFAKAKKSAVESVVCQDEGMELRSEF